MPKENDGVPNWYKNVANKYTITKTTQFHTSVKV